MPLRFGIVVIALGFLRAFSLPAVPELASAVTGERIQYTVKAGDTLGGLAAEFGVDAATIAHRNGLRLTTPIRVGRALTIDAVHVVPAATEPIVINIPQRHLFVVMPSGTSAYPVAVGRPGWPTPGGTFTVLTKEENPTWDVPLSIREEMRQKGLHVVARVPPCASNPLGAYWIGLSLPGIGLHSTNAPRSIYSAVTHGCIRVRPDRIGDLYRSVREGMAGRIVYEPALLAQVDDRVYVEVHRDIYGSAPPALTTLGRIAAAHGLDGLINWTAVADVVSAREGVAVDVTGPPRPVQRENSDVQRPIRP